MLFSGCYNLLYGLDDNRLVTIIPMSLNNCEFLIFCFSTMQKPPVVFTYNRIGNTL